MLSRRAGKRKSLTRLRIDGVRGAGIGCPGCGHVLRHELIGSAVTEPRRRAPDPRGLGRRPPSRARPGATSSRAAAGRDGAGAASVTVRPPVPREIGSPAAHVPLETVPGALARPVGSARSERGHVIQGPASPARRSRSGLDRLFRPTSPESECGPNGATTGMTVRCSRGSVRRLRWSIGWGAPRASRGGASSLRTPSHRRHPWRRAQWRRARWRRARWRQARWRRARERRTATEDRRGGPVCGARPRSALHPHSNRSRREQRDDHSEPEPRGHRRASPARTSMSHLCAFVRNRVAPIWVIVRVIVRTTRP